MCGRTGRRADNIWYDYDAYVSKGGTHTDAVGVLETRRTVCAGYASLTMELLRALGIPAKYCCGYALQYGSFSGWTEPADPNTVFGYGAHAWNEAYADGRWIILDTTWDSTNRYTNGKFSEGTGVKSARPYFDPTLECFSLDHKIVEYDDGFLPDAIFRTLSVKKNLTLKKGKTKQLSVKVSKDYAWFKMKDAKITYSSSNKKVATVSSSGKIKAKKAGNAVITTKVKCEGVTVRYDTNVTVKN